MLPIEKQVVSLIVGVLLFLFGIALAIPKKELKRYGTFRSFSEIHPDTLIGMGETLKKIENGELGCSMCGWYLDNKLYFTECGKCGFELRRD